jgi:hypothetical protein
MDGRPAILVPPPIKYADADLGGAVQFSMIFKVPLAEATKGLLDLGSGRGTRSRG